uniref:Baseplate J like protein n=1 Tax=Siphoviridae sp. ctP6113 TaxID=2826318 RepID=A0A8S5MUB1_9CAUD|nr:MAG TPA: Baseplate J like protein [Siphoviridae sp. ctP6113]
MTTSGVEIDTREGSYTNTLISQVAYALWQHSQLLAGLLPIVFPSAESGEYLDQHAAQLGMVRQPGTKARAEVTFTGTNGTVIPAGTAVYAPDSGLRYLTLEAATIAEETAVATVEAESIGADYNVPAGSITSMAVNVPGVDDLANLEAAAGGSDPESDVDLYTRIHDRLSLPITSGNVNHYIQWAKEVAGVSYASCIPLWAGNGTVKVVIAGADKGAVDEEIRSACAAHIEEEKPIGATVTVVSVTETELPVAAAVTLVEGYSTEDVTNQLTAAVSALLASQTFGQAVTIPFSRFLACLLQCAGVADYSILTVNGGTMAISVSAETVPVVGTVNVTET